MLHAPKRQKSGNILEVVATRRVLRGLAVKGGLGR
jgi:hypothetical protein